eukprot:6461606-Amphidinium_carterae.1
MKHGAKIHSCSRVSYESLCHAVIDSERGNTLEPECGKVHQTLHRFHMKQVGSCFLTESPPSGQLGVRMARATCDLYKGSLVHVELCSSSQFLHQKLWCVTL